MLSFKPTCGVKGKVGGTVGLVPSDLWRKKDCLPCGHWGTRRLRLKGPKERTLMSLPLKLLTIQAAALKLVK